MTGTDPFEKRLARALKAGGIAYERDDAESGLDFYLPDYSVFIEVKQFHSGRIAEQMSRRPGVIAIQGEAALAFIERVLARGALQGGGQEGER